MSTLMNYPVTLPRYARHNKTALRKCGQLTSTSKTTPGATQTAGQVRECGSLQEDTSSFPASTSARGIQQLWLLQGPLLMCTYKHSNTHAYINLKIL